MSKVVELSSYRQKKDPTKNPQGRTPLFVSHLDGKIKGSPHFKTADNVDFGERILRIRKSLERINNLMGELRRQESEGKSSEGSRQKN